MFKKAIVLCLVAFFVSTISTVLAIQKASKRIVSEDLVVQVDSSLMVSELFKVSPDSKRVAYGAKVGDKVLVVVDGKEGKPYHGIGSLIFSPDSKRVAYGAKVGDKWLVVVDGKEGKP